MPEALLPEINELRELGGQAPLDAEQFFDVALDAVPPEPAQPPAAPLAALAAKARPTYQKALVAWLRGLGSTLRRPVRGRRSHASGGPRQASSRGWVPGRGAPIAAPSSC